MSRVYETPTGVANKVASKLKLNQTECITVIGKLHGQHHATFVCRQGGMSRWLPVSNMWQECHFVLTRAGFLHWFLDTEHVRPVDCLNLARCQFEAGEAPTFNLVENNTGRIWFFSNWLRTVAFKAPSVEDCCEWAIALREAIANAHGEVIRTH